ncbi:hypothetical protein C3L33_14341, partial [Rhododendron williamsianum]
VPLSRKQCFLLISAGSLSHFFLDHLFENPRLKRRIGLFCRVKSLNSIRNRSNESMRLILIIASLYCLWCASQIYLVNPRRAPVGEEADLGVLVFLGIYLFLPHGLCIMSMNPKEYAGSEEQLPL